MRRFNLMVASTVGTTLEWYDFFTFAACAALVFNSQFFPTNDPATAQILALGTFSVGFIARPLGGFLFGIAGDRYGRKQVLIVSLLMMGLGTTLIGLLPTFSTAGLLAPIALVCLRFAQGVAVGGEASGAMLIVAESMPEGRRGFWTSFTMFSGPLANVLTAAVISIIGRLFGEEAFVAWAWRIPFLISVLLVGVGYWSRRHIEESPVFQSMAQDHSGIEQSPLRFALRNHPGELTKAFFVKTSENTFLYVFTTYFLIFATEQIGLSRTSALNVVLIGSAIEVPVILASGYASDLFGRRPILIIGIVASAFSAYGLFMLDSNTPFSAAAATMGVCLCSHGIIAGTMAAYMTELFPARIRYTAMSASYQLASVAGGAVAPIIGVTLQKLTGSSLSVAVYGTLMAVPALISLLLSREMGPARHEQANCRGSLQDDLNSTNQGR